jgi:hypothetical protein
MFGVWCLVCVWYMFGGGVFGVCLVCYDLTFDMCVVGVFHNREQKVNNAVGANMYLVSNKLTVADYIVWNAMREVVVRSIFSYI